MHQVVVVTGPGAIGQAIARRVSAGKHVVLADLHQDNADRAAEVMRNADLRHFKGHSRTLGQATFQSP